VPVRRLTSILAFLAFANLSLVQAGGFCPLTLSGAHSADTVAHSTSQHDTHGGHLASAAESVGEADLPADAGHASCVMMGPCGLTVDLGRVMLDDADLHHEPVMAVSDTAPKSTSTSPDIPPPRA
jgi:hypothetical protein